jgi:nitrate reductase NapE component
MHCAVIYGNKTEKWSSCIPFLERALQYASSQEVKSRIQKNLEIVKGNEKVYDGLKPLSSAPSLSTFNGIGMTLYGATDHDEVSGSYLSTYYFVFLAIPLFPICRYRVIKTVGGYQFLGKSPLRKFDKWHIAIFLGILFWMFTHG